MTAPAHAGTLPTPFKGISNTRIPYTVPSTPWSGSQGYPVPPTIFGSFAITMTLLRLCPGRGTQWDSKGVAKTTLRQFDSFKDEPRDRFCDVADVYEDQFPSSLAIL